MSRPSASNFQRRDRAHQGGFTLLELVVVIIIIGLLVVIALGKLLKIREQAERAAVTQVIGNLRSSLGMQIAEMIVKQDRKGLLALAGSNPMDLLSQVPGNYLGALGAPDPARIGGHTWYFDERDQALVYRVEYAGHFHTTLRGPPRIRFKIRLQYVDKNHNGVYDPGIDTLQGLDLVALDRYTWRYHEHE